MIAQKNAGRLFSTIKAGTPPGSAEGHPGPRSATSRLDSADRARRLARIRRLAWLLDSAVRVPGTRFRFGLNSVIGLTPAAGDAAMAALSIYVVYEASRLGLPKTQLAKMLGNVVIESMAGAVPLLGDLFDATFKANMRNIALIDAHFGTPGARA